MIDIFLLMISVAAHSAPGSDAPAPMPQGSAMANPEKESAEAMALAKESAEAMAPAKESAEGAANPPAFLSPSDGTKTAAAAPPVFLAPAESGQSNAAPPAFLSPDDKGAQPALQAEPQIPTGKFTVAAEVKPILGMTKGNWIAVREFNGQDLLYVTHLLSWRCGLVQMKLGLNGAAPEIWPLPPCHEDMATPNALLESDGLPYKAFPLGSIQQVEVHVTFDDLSTDSAKFDRRGVQIP